MFLRFLEFFKLRFQMNSAIRKNALTDRQSDRPLDQPMDGPMDRWTDGWMERRTNGPRDRPLYRDAWSHLKTINMAKDDVLLLK